MLDTIEYEVRGAVCTFTGGSSLHAILSAFEQVCMHPSFHTFRFIIYDLKAVSHLAYDEDSMTYFAAATLGSLYVNKSVVGACVTTDPEAKLLVDQYNKLTARTIQVFQTIDEAKYWATRIQAEWETPHVFNMVPTSPDLLTTSLRP